VVQAILEFPERDLFLRGVRAFAGFRQTGVDYVRPERMFGTSTNSLLKNIGWAKKGILSFSTAPLNILSFTGFTLFCISVVLGIYQITVRLLFPDLTPRSVTTTLVLILFFGSANLFAASLLGEYVAKVFEEVKRRPLFIRRSFIRDGEVRPATDRASISGARE
jgi:polyisoprenyl-phosphate glycosyltransferase